MERKIGRTMEECQSSVRVVSEYCHSNGYSILEYSESSVRVMDIQC